MQSNNSVFKKRLKEYSLTRKNIAGLMAVNISTVDRWLVPRTKMGEKNPTFRAMPDSKMILLGLILATLKKEE